MTVAYSILIWFVLIANLLLTFVIGQASKSEKDMDVTHMLVEKLLSENEQDISYLILQPSILDFHELAIGDADSDVVTVFNKHANRSVYLGAISGSLPDFYSSFFEEKIIPPMGNTTFNVVYLPRQQGSVQANLLIHTSFGVINYQVKGKGVECLFRLNPLVGLQTPFNATLTPEIYMYNPYSTTLQITEVYSSGGQFHLELPTGGPEGPKALWEIPPHCSKPIIRVRFSATSPGISTAYIRIKVSSGNDTELQNVILVVPIEVEITTEYGIYSKIPILNFGLGGNKDAPKEIVVRLLNSGEESIDIQNYSVEGDVNVISGVSVNVNPIEKNDNSYKTIKVVTDWSNIKSEKYFNGNIIIMTSVKNRDSIYKIPFFGEIMKGAIHYNHTALQFVTSNTIDTKDFVLKNNYNVSLAITNASIPEQYLKFLKVDEFIPKILQPGEEILIFKISKLNSEQNTDKNKYILLYTNISTYEIPVITYNGLLRRIVSVDKTTLNPTGIDEKLMNFGTLSLSTLSDTLLAFVNENPIPIAINNWKATISGVASIVVILRGCGNLTIDNLKFCYSIEPGEWIVFQVSVLSNAVGSFIGNFCLTTNYEEIITPVKFSAAVGRIWLTAKMLNESQCFPGGICSVNLTAHSTFLQAMKIDDISVNVSGETYDYSNINFPEIAPNSITQIGPLHFSPKPVCSDDCYIDFPDRWSPAIISENCKYIEKDLMSNKLEMFRAMKESFSSINYKIQINQLKKYEFNESANLLWPKLVEGPVEFPAIQIGHENVKFITVNNPLNETIMAYYMLHDVSYNGAAMTYPPEIITLCWDCFLTRENVFSFVDPKIKGMQFDYIPPKSKSQIAVMFTAQTPGKYATLLYIRNNFTIMEAIWITAKSVVPQFKFGNRKPGSHTPLLFELSDKHLRDCMKKNKNNDVPLMVTAKRTFTARNTGDVPIMISNIRIGSEKCEGFGFHVVNCHPFELAPNGSKKIEIAFTPDFTLARVVKMLDIETSLKYSVNYTLLSMIPAQALGACGKALSRPLWELSMQYTVLCVFIVSFLLVLLVSFLDSDKVLKDHIYYMSKDKGPVQPTLDFRHIGLSNYSDDTDLTPPNNTTKNIISTKRAEKKRCEIEANKKSWATVLAKKFAPIKTDVKFRETTPPNTKNTEHKKEIAKKIQETEIAETAKQIEDDSSSTTTDISIQSAEPEVKNCTNYINKKMLPVNDIQENKLKLKYNVKKTKNLPIQPVAVPKEMTTALPQAKPVKFTTNKSPNGKIPRNQPENNLHSDNKCDTIIKISPTSPAQEKQQNIQKKYAKTPGRERKKNEIPRKSNIKMSSHKGTAFQFTSPLTNSSSVVENSPIWNTNKISFSNVVAQNPFTSETLTTPLQPMSLFENNKKNSICKCVQSDDDDGQNRNHVSSKNVLPNAFPSTNKSSIDLGPIGSRKSPFSTPIWEPLSSIEKPIATLNGNPNSFFSGIYPHYPTTYDTELSHKNQESDIQLLGGASGLLENVYGQNITNHQRVWDSSLLISVLQQQKEVENLSALYSNTNNLWTPEVSQHQKLWCQGPIRPPPGLELIHEKNANAGDEQTSTLPPFNPFSSLSSIWSNDPFPDPKIGNDDKKPQ